MDEVFTIRQVDVTQIYQLRLNNLRAGRPIQSVYFDGDSLPTTLHFALFVRDVAVGCATLVANNNKLFDVSIQYQLRGMAVDEQYRGRKYGLALLKYAEWLCLNRNVDFVWLNARCHVTDFYHKSGYNTAGEPFDIPDVCPHIIMYKRLTPHNCSGCRR